MWVILSFPWPFWTDIPSFNSFFWYAHLKADHYYSWQDHINIIYWGTKTLFLLRKSSWCVPGPQLPYTITLHQWFRGTSLLCLWLMNTEFRNSTKEATCRPGTHCAEDPDTAGASTRHQECPAYLDPCTWSFDKLPASLPLLIVQQ